MLTRVGAQFRPCSLRVRSKEQQAPGQAFNTHELRPESAGAGGGGPEASV